MQCTFNVRLCLVVALSLIPLSLDGVSVIDNTTYCAARIRISGFFLPVFMVLTISKRMELPGFEDCCDVFHIKGVV